MMFCSRSASQARSSLLGLYHGVSLNHKSVMDLPRQPDMVFLYRRPILEQWAESGETLGDLITHVLVHEIGHHFGFPTLIWATSRQRRTRDRGIRMRWTLVQATPVPPLFRERKRAMLMAMARYSGGSRKSL